MKARRYYVLCGVTLLGVAAVVGAWGDPTMRMHRRTWNCLASMGQSIASAVSAPDEPKTFQPMPVGQQNMLLEHDGSRRHYVLFVPSTYDPSRAHPLTLFFHGGGRDAMEFSDKRQDLIEQAEERGFVLVFMSGLAPIRWGDSTWNAMHCCGTSFEDDVDDIGLTRRVVAEVSDLMNIDESRVFAGGFSNGGMLTHRLASEASDLFRAVAPVAATIGGQPSLGASQQSLGQRSLPWVGLAPSGEIQHALSLFMIHGKADQNVRYDGGQSLLGNSDRFDLSLEASSAFWIEQLDCDIQPQQSSSTQGVLTEVYGNCEGDNKVVVVSPPRMRHQWPTSANSDYEGSRQIMAFFDSFN